MSGARQVDALGNLRAITGTDTTPNTFKTEVDLSLPANSSYTLFLGFGFYDQTTMFGPPLENTAVFQHAAFPVFGSFHLGGTPQESIAWLSGNGSGVATLPIDVCTLTPAFCNEAELYLQAVVSDTTTGLIRGTTNRLRVELNWQ